MIKEVKVGDEVTCKGMTVKIAEVVSSHNYGSDESPDWYIEFHDESGQYRYWKQSIDGGYITHAYMVEIAERAKELTHFAKHNSDTFSKAIKYLEIYRYDMDAMIIQLGMALDDNGIVTDQTIIDKISSLAEIIDSEYCERISKRVSEILSALKRYNYTVGM